MEKMEQIIMEMMEYVCDNLCAYPDDASCEKLNAICKDCKMGSFLKRIEEERKKYSHVVLCRECEYCVEDKDGKDNPFTWCRNIEVTKEKDGCSRGKRKGAI